MGFSPFEQSKLGQVGGLEKGEAFETVFGMVEAAINSKCKI
jgi:hypothetical protein